jgi:hypothetical protein
MGIWGAPLYIRLLQFLSVPLQIIVNAIALVPDLVLRPNARHYAIFMM